MQRTTATTILGYNALHKKQIRDICTTLQRSIDTFLPKSESKIWHGSPVWFIEGNPIVSYSVRKDGRVSLMFFSGQSFKEKDLKPEGSFKAAEIFYTTADDIRITHLRRWLTLARKIQWDYKNIVKNRGLLKKMQTAPTVAVTKSKQTTSHDEKMARMTFASVYPLYLAKVTKKQRTKQELDTVITWLTGYTNTTLQKLITSSVTFEEFFQKAKLHKHAHLITGMICGYRIEDITNPLTQKVRYLDKLVDELAKGRAMEKILRAG